MGLIEPKNSLLMIIDVQDKLIKMLDKDIVVKKNYNLAKAAQILSIPIIATEQYPTGLGKTTDIIRECINECDFVEKTSFSACREDGFLTRLRYAGKKQIILSGIETHICVKQTALELLDAGFEVFVVKDACASRNKYEFKEGIDSMRDAGCKITCVEMVLFEWLRSSKHPNFKEVQTLIK